MSERPPESSYVQVSTLDPEKQRLLAEKELAAEQLYRSRFELFNVFSKVKPFLRKQKMQLSNGNTVDRTAVTLKDIVAATTDEELQALLDPGTAGGAGKKLSLAGGRVVKTEQSTQVAALVEQLKMVQILAQMSALRAAPEAPPNPGQEFYGYQMKEYERAQHLLRLAEQDHDRLEESLDQAHASLSAEREDALTEELENNEAMVKFLVETNPEAYYAFHYNQIREMQQVFDTNGTIVETPYVKKQIERFLEMFGRRQPIFIHGELGSGKSELAKHISRHYLAAPYMDRWEKGDAETHLPAHPRPVDKKSRDAWRAYLRRVRPMNDEYSVDSLTDAQLLQEWELERRTAAEPLIISGHKGIDIEQILGGVKIEMNKVLSPEERLEIIKQKELAYRKEYDRDDLTDVERDRLERDVFLLQDACKESFKNPVETKVYFAAFYKAMREGKPVIIDEMNAIPHHVLIMLNDLLTVRPGDKVKPMLDDAPPFTVKEGFCVIATGNWRPGDDEIYVQRQKMDAAFLSRFGRMHYDYLPNATKSGALLDVDRTADPEEYEKQVEAQREERAENELFHMLVVRLMDKRQGLELPPGGVDELYRLARVSRLIQDVFSGKDVDKAYFAKHLSSRTGDTNPREVLKENVISFRTLIPLVSMWKKQGFSRSLSEYVFSEYVQASTPRPEEMKWLYQLLQLHGQFFPVDQGWPNGQSQQSLDSIVDFSLDKLPSKVARKEKVADKVAALKAARKSASASSPEKSDAVAGARRYYPPKEVIDLMFGQAPLRSDVNMTEAFAEPSSDVEDDEAEDEMSESVMLLRKIQGEWKDQKEFDDDDSVKMAKPLNPLFDEEASTTIKK